MTLFGISVSPVHFVAVPLFAAFLIPLIGKLAGGFVKFIPGIVLLYLSAVAVSLFSFVMESGKPIVEILAGWKAPIGINLYFDAFSGFLTVILTLVGFLAWLYSLRYMKEEPLQKFYMLFMLLITGSTGIVLTGDIFNLFVFLEITAIAAYSLTAFLRDHDGAEAAFKYLLIGSFASTFVLLGIILLYAHLGTLNMADIADKIHLIPMKSRAFILILFIVGLGIEAELFPLNGWAPDAYSQAPSPIGAVFGGIVVKAAVYALMRVLFTLFNISSVFDFLIIIGLVTLLLAEMAAMKQHQIKRMLAFSSIGQMGLIIIAFSLGTQAGVEGALFHMVNHAFIKVLLFFTAGYLVFHTGTKYITDLKGVGREKPITAFFFTLAALAIIGLPPFAGFWSKLSILMAIADEGKMILVMVILASALIEAVYYLRVISIMYYKGPEIPQVRQVPLSGLIAMGILATIILVIGFQPGLLQPIFEAAGRELLDSSQYIQQSLMSGF